MEFCLRVGRVSVSNLNLIADDALIVTFHVIPRREPNYSVLAIKMLSTVAEYAEYALRIRNDREYRTMECHSCQCRTFFIQTVRSGVCFNVKLHSCHEYVRVCSQTTHSSMGFRYSKRHQQSRFIYFCFFPQSKHWMFHWCHAIVFLNIFPCCVFFFSNSICYSSVASSDVGIDFRMALLINTLEHTFASLVICTPLGGKK